MATKAKAAVQKDEAPEKDAPDTPESPLPLLDLSDAAVRKMIKAAKKRGYVTHDELNAVMPSEEVSSDQIEDIYAMLNEMGINVVDSEEAEADGEEAAQEGEEEETEGELVEVAAKPLAVKETKEPTERTDDPVRMYLREMGSVELLSREGEIAIAKRIEAGREAMIAGLCESPLTFQAVIIWREELNNGKVFLRDIIDLEATYAGPDAKTPAAPGGEGQPGATGGTPFQAGAPAVAPAAPTPFKAANGSNGSANGGANANGRAAPAAGDEEMSEEDRAAAAAAESDYDEDDMESSLSLAAIEAELKPKVLETFDAIADNYKKLRRLQDQDIENRPRCTQLRSCTRLRLTHNLGAALFRLRRRHPSSL
jgi:RNA polymerase primary sigma factor